jgi:hypothetical protein
MERHAEVARLASEFEVGFVVPPGDAAALARTISECRSNPVLLEEMGDRARALAEQKYDRRLITRSFDKVLQTVLHLPSTPRMGDERKAAFTAEIESVATMPGE